MSWRVFDQSAHVVPKRWFRFLIKRQVLLALRDNPGLVLFCLLLLVVVPALSIRGAQELSKFVAAGAAAGVAMPLDRYVGWFLFFQTTLLVVGFLYLAKAHRRPVHYLFLPVAYAAYLAAAVKRIILSVLLVNVVLYVPLEWYINRGLGRSYTLYDGLFLALVTVTLAVLAGCLYLGILRLVRATRIAADGLARRLSGLAIAGIVLLVAGLLLWRPFFEWWTLGLRSALVEHVILSASAALVVCVALRLLVGSQPEYPLSHAVRAVSRTWRRRSSFSFLVTRRTLLMLLNWRQTDINIMFLVFASALAGLALVMRLGSADVAQLAQSVATAILPYAAVMFALNARSNLFGLGDDGLRYLPLRAGRFAVFGLLVSVALQTVLSLGLVGLVVGLGRLGLELSAAGQFAAVSVAIASVAYLLGTLFYKSALGQRLGAVVLFLGVSVVLQAVLQEVGQWRFGLLLAALVIFVGAAVAVVVVEKSRSSRYAGA